MPAHRFPSSDWPITRLWDVAINRLKNVTVKGKTWWAGVGTLTHSEALSRSQHLAKFSDDDFVKVEINIFQISTWPHIGHVIKRSCGFNPIQDGLFRGWSRMRERQKGPLLKICHTYPSLMKLGTVTLYLKKTPKIYKTREKPLEFCWDQNFFTGNQQILLNQEMQI